MTEYDRTRTFISLNLCYGIAGAVKVHVTVASKLPSCTDCLGIVKDTSSARKTISDSYFAVVVLMTLVGAPSVVIVKSEPLKLVLGPFPASASWFQRFVFATEIVAPVSFLDVVVLSVNSVADAVNS